MEAILIISLVAVVLVVFTVLYIVNKIRNFTRSALGTNITSLVEQMKKADIEIQTTPRSLSGGDIIFEPMVLKDFSHFHKETVFADAEHCLISCLRAIETKDISKVSEYGEGIVAYVNARINENNTMTFQTIRIHKRCISGYRKTKQYSTVSIQVAYEYKVLVNGEDKGLQQMKAEMEYTYLFQDTNVSNVIGTVCPNCGAPVDTVNQTKCKYCDVGIIGIIEKTWIFSNIRDV